MFSKRLLITLISGSLLLAGTLIAIQFAKGYRFSRQGILQGTGLLAANSFPNGAQVYVNGKLSTATDNTLNLDPGEYDVEIKKDGIYVNNQPLAEQYLVRSYESHELKPAAKVSLGANEYYVMGDNRDHSRDSRELGPIPRQNIVSHVWFRLLPPKSARVFAHINYQIAP